MPDDLLQYVGGPPSFSSWWSWLAASSSAIVVTWYLGVVIVTRRTRRLRDVPLIGYAHDKMLKRRYLDAIRAIGDEHRSGKLAAAPAAAGLSQAVRAFLQKSTGIRAEYMQLDELASGDLASAADLLTRLNDAQFNLASHIDVAVASASAEELVRSWT